MNVKRIRREQFEARLKGIEQELQSLMNQLDRVKGKIDRLCSGKREHQTHRRCPTWWLAVADRLLSPRTATTQTKEVSTMPRPRSRRTEPVGRPVPPASQPYVQGQLADLRSQVAE